MPNPHDHRTAEGGEDRPLRHASGGTDGLTHASGASHKQSLAVLPPALRPSRPIEEWGFSSSRKRIYNSAGAPL